jgi:glycosyltransferase involved in cell wall biosynthesis
LDSQIEWRGALPQLAVLPLLEAADLFCLPSRIAADGDRDGVPNVLLEAMSMELPVVTTAVSAIPELVRHEENGLLVAPDDPGELAGAIARLIRDRGLRQRLGKAGRSRVLRDFSEAASLDQLADRFGLVPRPASKVA